jgi:ABC-2 type transport system ATP-binding protein
MSPPPPASIRVRDLTKRYGAVAAIQGISFEVSPGEIFGLLGLNGAGKTTIIECLLGLRAPDEGTLTLADIDMRQSPHEARRRVGAQLQFAALQARITPREALGLFASFYTGAAKPDALLDQFDLRDKADASYDSLSGGQRQRLFLALAFVNQPQVLVLDEPTTGLDPQSRRELHRLITALKSSGRTVLLSTHYLEEAHLLCDRIGILHEGRLIAVGTPAELISRSRALPRISFRTSRLLDASLIAALPGVVCHEAKGDGWLVSTKEINRCISGLVQMLDANDAAMLDLQIHQPSLEDVFLELTGKPWPEVPPSGGQP